MIPVKGQALFDLVKLCRLLNSLEMKRFKIESLVNVTKIEVDSNNEVLMVIGVFALINQIIINLCQLFENSQ